MPRKKRQSQQPFNHILRAIMRDRGLKLADIAKMAGVSVSVAGDWTADVFPSDMNKVKTLADQLGISFTYLVTGQSEERKFKNSFQLVEMLTEGEPIEGFYKISVQKLNANKILDKEEKNP